MTGEYGFTGDVVRLKSSDNIAYSRSTGRHTEECRCRVATVSCATEVRFYGSNLKPAILRDGCSAGKSSETVNLGFSSSGVRYMTPESKVVHGVAWTIVRCAGAKCQSVCFNKYPNLNRKLPNDFLF